MFVARPSFDRDILESNLRLEDKGFNQARRDLHQKNFLIVRGLERSSFARLCATAALGLPPEDQVQLLDTFIECSLAKYQMATHVGSAMTIELFGERHELVPEDKDYVVSEHNWALGYFAALARRKMAVVRQFCEIDLDVVRDRDRTKGGPHSLLFAKFLQRLFVKGEPHGKNLLAAAQAIQPDAMPEATYDHALHVDGPLIDLFVPIFSGDADDFDAMLQKALELHVKYWQRQPRNFLEGLVSVPLTALAVMAKDYDLEFRQRSDLLLLHLID
jgi:hypothetical protein